MTSCFTCWAEPVARVVAEQGRCFAPQPELEAQAPRRLSAKPQPRRTRVDPAQMVPGAERDAVALGVGAPGRAEARITVPGTRRTGRPDRSQGVLSHMGLPLPPPHPSTDQHKRRLDEGGLEAVATTGHGRDGIAALQ